MSDRSPLRLVVLRVVVVAVLATLLGRLAYLQVGKGGYYAAAASSNRVREVVTPAARGLVLDDLGRPLVSNRTALEVTVVRSVVTSQPHHGSLVLQRLARVVHSTPATILRDITPCGEKQADGSRATAPNCWSGSPYAPVPVASFDVSVPAQRSQVLLITEHAEDYPGITAHYAAVRAYPGGSLAAQALGYLGPVSADDEKNKAYAGLAPGSLIGRTGLEAEYDAALRGTDGVQRLLVNNASTVTGTSGSTPAVAGDDLVLSVDEGVQALAEKALAAGIAKAHAPGGAAVVVEVGTGRVVALASNPTYDPAEFVPRISSQAYTALTNAPGHPLFSNATQGLFAPGSTFKIVSTAAAVAGGVPLSTDEPCPGGFSVGGRTFHNFEGETLGTISFRTALIKSCDTFFYKLAYDQWVRDGGVKNTPAARQVFSTMAKAFGFGSSTGIDLPDERRGTITDRQYKVDLWNQTKVAECKRAKTGYPEVTDPTRAAYLLALAKEYCSDGYRYNGGDAVLFAIGQGDVLVTPLQLAMAYSAIANGGTVWEPRLAKALLHPDGSVSPVRTVAKGRLPVAADTLAYIRSALAGVTQPGGTAGGAFAGLGLAVAGKTGTADAFGKTPTSWFASFGPVAAPKYAVVVMVPEGGQGATTSAPIARQIWAGMYGLDGQKPLLGAGGALPGSLPVLRADGTVGPPGTPKPRRVVPAPAASAPVPTAAALGPLLWRRESSVLGGGE